MRPVQPLGRSDSQAREVRHTRCGGSAHLTSATRRHAQLQEQRLPEQRQGGGIQPALPSGRQRRLDGAPRWLQLAAGTAPSAGAGAAESTERPPGVRPGRSTFPSSSVLAAASGQGILGWRQRDTETDDRAPHPWCTAWQVQAPINLCVLAAASSQAFLGWRQRQCRDNGRELHQQAGGTLRGSRREAQHPPHTMSQTGNLATRAGWLPSALPRPSPRASQPLLPAGSTGWTRRERGRLAAAHPTAAAAGDERVTKLNPDNQLESSAPEQCP